MAGDGALFLPPGGWEGVDDSVPDGAGRGAPPNGPGWEVTKLVAGLSRGRHQAR